MNSTIDASNLLESIDIPYRFLESEQSISTSQASGIVSIDSESISESLNLFSLSPRIGVGGIFKEDKDYAHSWKAFVSGELWVDEIGDNGISFNGQDDTNASISGNIRPITTDSLPFPSTLDEEVERNYYTTSLPRIPVDAYPELKFRYSIGVGYNYQRFRDYDKGLKIGVELLFHPSLICLLYTSPSPRDATLSRMPSSA